MADKPCRIIEIPDYYALDDVLGADRSLAFPGVANQILLCLYPPVTALRRGTMFPELDMPLNTPAWEVSPGDMDDDLSRLCALEFAVNDLRLYLRLHPYDNCAADTLRALEAQTQHARHAYDSATQQPDDARAWRRTVWQHDDKLFYPLSTLTPDAHDAALVRQALLGAHGEAHSAAPYFLARFDMPLHAVAMLLLDIGAEELAHAELLGAMARMLDGRGEAGATEPGVAEAGVAEPGASRRHSADKPGKVWQAKSDEQAATEQAAAEQAAQDSWEGTWQTMPHAQPEIWPSDPVACLTCAMAHEQCARALYDALIKRARSADVIAPLRFLRQREIVHFQRVGEALEALRAKLDKRNPYKS